MVLSNDESELGVMEVPPSGGPRFYELKSKATSG